MCGEREGERRTSLIDPPHQFLMQHLGVAWSNDHQRRPCIRQWHHLFEASLLKCKLYYYVLQLIMWMPCLCWSHAELIFTSALLISKSPLVKPHVNKLRRLFSVVRHVIYSSLSTQHSFTSCSISQKSNTFNNILWLVHFAVGIMNADRL